MTTSTITSKPATRGRKTFTVHSWTCPAGCGRAAQAPDRSFVERTEATHQCPAR
jgi:hypothetical protein